MKKKSTTARYSLSEVEALRKRGPHEPNLDKTRRNALPAEPLGTDFWKSASVALDHRSQSTVVRRVKPPTTPIEPFHAP